MNSIRYSVDLFDAARHILLVSMHIESAEKGYLPPAIDLALPAWIPGSYMVRDFARNVTEINARHHRKSQKLPLKLEKLDKHTWRVEPGAKAQHISVSMLVYAWDLSVRGAHFDQTHCFFNGTSVFLRAIGFENCTHEVSIQATAPGLEDWAIATSMPCSKGLLKTPLPLSDSATKSFAAANYDELIDHPFEIGKFQHCSFKAGGATHHVVITGNTNGTNTDSARVCADLKLICDAQIQFFEPTTRKPPYKDYWFLITAVGDGYGGLEHRASTALICGRNDLPYHGMPSLNLTTPTGVAHEGYQTFLGLASHEFFHTWNVKRIKPQTFGSYDLDKEHYTRLLWIFEGFTSYYDDLFLVRSGLIDEKTYLKTLAKTLSSVQKTPGRLRQSVADSSFDAWTKYYKQDENSINAIVSYYTKGSLVALALDLTIRAKTFGNKTGIKSLDDVMRLLWSNYKSGQLLDENEFVSIVEKASGVDVFLEVKNWAYGTEDIVWQPLLAELGLALKWQGANDDAVWLGGKFASSPSGLTVQNAVGHGAVANAGISAGDVIIAMNGIKASDVALKALLQRSKPDDSVTVHAFRRDELMTFNLQLMAPPAHDAHFQPLPKPSKQQKKQYAGWLKPQPTTVK
jgi:predicted metalloprotease with PDZ domain